MIFDAAGNFIRGWGGAGAGYEWPEREHGIHIDSKGFVWVGGNNCPGRNLPGLKALGDDQLLKFTQAGKFVMQIGHRSQSKGNADTVNFQQPADAVYYAKTNELFVADGYGNHRVIVVDATTGAFKRMWGAFGNKPADNYGCPPPSLSSVPDGPGPAQFSIVHAIRVSNDGMVYVADRENRRVQEFTLEGKFVKQVGRGSVCARSGVFAGPAVPVCRRRERHCGGESEDDGDRRDDRAAGDGGRRPPDAGGFKRQPIYCRDDARIAEAGVQRPEVALQRHGSSASCDLCSRGRRLGAEQALRRPVHLAAPADAEAPVAG
jgi:hypothetical protein